MDVMDPITTGEHLGSAAELRARRMLVEYLQVWSAQTLAEATSERDPFEAEYMRGYSRALADIAGHLEAGDILPADEFTHLVA